MGEFLIDVATVQWAYFGLLTAFTICLAMLLPLTPSSGLKWWLASNITAALAMPFFIWRPALENETLAFFVPSILVITSAALKLLAVSSFALRGRLIKPLTIAILAFVALYHIFDHLDLIVQRLALSMAALSMLTGAVAMAAKNNSVWNGMWGRTPLIAAFAVHSVVFMAVALRVISGDISGVYFASGSSQSYTFALSIIQVIIVHIGFIALVVGRLAKITALKSTRQGQLIRQRKNAEQYSRKMEAIAQERRALLDLLSHEVRQPLNNAQAALQEISRTIGQRKLNALEMSQPVSRLYNTIDQVVLVLSNAIVGANVIERRTNQERREVEITAIAQLALGDCPLGEQPRIALTGLLDPIFIMGDPILLRLAFRNLLDNALKFSLPHTKVTAVVRIDSNRLGVAFEVFNVPQQQFNPDARLFNRAHRTDSELIPGKGLGLFIVQEVAQIHDGAAAAYVSADGQTCFELFLPL